jgi:hypothetical protein
LTSSDKFHKLFATFHPSDHLYEPGSQTLRQRNRLKALENVGKAIQIFKGCGADGWVEKYEKELATFL